MGIHILDSKKSLNAIRGLAWLSACVLVAPVQANADAGIPMLPLAYPAILLLLIPVIVLEAVFVRLRLGTPWRKTFLATAKANAFTLLLGYPFAWFILVIFESAIWAVFALTGIADRLPPWTNQVSGIDIFIVAISAAWLGPAKEKWPLLAAFVLLLIPSFILSGIVETRMLNETDWSPRERKRRRCTPRDGETNPPLLAGRARHDARFARFLQERKGRRCTPQDEETNPPLLAGRARHDARFARFRFPKDGTLGAAVWHANIVSYVFLAITGCFLLLKMWY